MKVISVANRKGGVGKTTVALNIAYELSKKGFRVLTIDLDEQCDLTKVLLEKVDDSGISQIIEKQIGIEDTIYTVYDQLDMISGSKDVVHISSTSENMSIKDALDLVKEEYDYVLIDHPPNLNEASLQGLLASDNVLIVTDVEAFGMVNLSDLVDDLLAISSELNPNLKILGIVANKVDLRRNLTKKKLKELEDTLGDDLFETYISNDTSIPTSHDSKVPVREIPWRSRVVNQFVEVTNELLKRVGDL